MTAYLVTKSGQGEETLQETDSAAPGETIEYLLVYRNTGKGSLSGLNITGPVPANTVYLAGSALTVVAADLEVSIDHGELWEKEPVKRVRKQSDGSMREVVVEADEYTGIRWLPKEALLPGTVQKYHYRVVIR